MHEPPLTVPGLPDEILLHILSFLDIPELLAISRTSHHLRYLSNDPILHTHRLLRASLSLELWTPIRPSLATLLQQRIYITRTTLAARHLGRNLIKIKLNRSLSRRPTLDTLVHLNILPSETLSCPQIAPSLISTKHRIERERVKDKLRGFLEGWRRKGGIMARGVEEGRPDVRRMARRFGSGLERKDEVRWGMGRGKRREEPPRAKVLGLRRFWEGVGKSAGVGA